MSSSPPVGHRAILFGLLLGVLLGLAANLGGRHFVMAGGPDLNGNGLHDGVDWVAFNLADTVGQVFLRLMSMMVVPLVLSALSLAVVGLGDVRSLGRLGLRTLFWTATFSSVAVLIGVTLVNVVRPGESLPLEKREALRAQYGAAEHAGDDVRKAVDNARKAKSLRDTLLDIIPKNHCRRWSVLWTGVHPAGGCWL